MPNWTPAQQCALQLTGRDILVSAAAGSGKTATLTERIIRSLTEVDENGRHVGDISRMLVVTFTRAAAAELRARISKALSAAIAEHPDDPYLYDQLLALGNARISTIDAFYLEPVRANFERLGLLPGFRLGDDAELMPLKEQVLNSLIEDHYRASAAREPAPEATPDALEGNAFALAMDDLLPNRDKGDTVPLLLSLYEKLIAFPAGMELLRQNADRLCREAAHPFAESREGQVLVASLCEQLTSYRTALQAACDLLKMEEITAKKYLPSFAHDLDTVEQVLAELDAKRWDEAGRRLAAYRPIALGSVSKSQPLCFDPAPLKAARDKITKQLREIAPKYFAEDEETLRAQMLHTARTGRMLYTLLCDYDRTIRAQKSQRGVLDFSDVRRYLLELLTDRDGQPTDIARALNEQFDAVYIDEYQDVDTVQDLLFSLVGAGGKRFMVGDLKQSIYSFRGAEPSLFSDYRRRFAPVTSPNDAPDAVGCCVFMSDNFRCDRPVIEFTNAVCGHIFSACPDTLGYQSEDDLICSKTRPEGAPAPVPVEVVLLETPPKAEQMADPDPATALNPEAVYVADEIARLLREEVRADGQPYRPSDIAVLLRSAAMAPDVVSALRAHGIETSYAARDDLASHPDMMLMVDLLSVIDNPRDDVPLMGLLATPASPLALADILAVRSTGKQALPLYDDIVRAAADPDCPWSEETRARVRALLGYLDRWRDLAAALPIDRLLRRLYSEPFLAERATSPALLALYDRARNYQNAAFCGLYQFLPYLKKLLQDPAAFSAAGLEGKTDAVGILTIHKSKGLEFPAVFVCGCGSRFNEKDQRSPLMFDPTLGAAARIYHAEDASQRETVTRRAMARLLNEKQTEEEMRVLYVALTRARERLCLTARLKGQAQKLLERVGQPARGDRYATMSGSTYIEWVLGALHSPDCRLDPTMYRLTVLNREQYLHPHPSAALSVATEHIEAAPAIDQEGDFYRNIVRAHGDYVDPRAALRRLPVKAAASKLRTALLDLDEALMPLPERLEGEKERGEMPDTGSAQEVRHRIELMSRATRPFDELLRDSHRATAAERGTATHLFLQYCDFSRLRQTGVDAETERLCADGFLPRTAAEILRRDQLTAFAESDLCDLLCRPDVTIFRELHFDRFLPYARLTRNAETAAGLEGYSLYVQGSLDLLVQTDKGELWLCDYKTDRLPESDPAAIRARLFDAHADQLRIYAEAVTGLFDRRPDHILIYSLPLGQSIDMTDAL